MSNTGPTSIVVDYADRHRRDSSSSATKHPSQEDDIEAQAEKDDTFLSPPPRTADFNLTRTQTATSQDTAGNVGPRNSITSHLSVRSLRKRGRAETNQTMYSADEMGRATGWTPGQEPGIDTAAPRSYFSAGDADMEDSHPETVQQQCEITIVDYSAETISIHNLDNYNLADFLERPAEESSQVRWINVNGLSWDVIRLIGNSKGLHRLAIEDLMNTKNRTKADWYHDHTYIVLPLQKLVNLDNDDGRYSDGDDTESLRTGTEFDGEKYLPTLDGGRSEYNASISENRRRRRAMSHMKRRGGAIQALMSDIFKSKGAAGVNHQKRNRLSRTHRKTPKVQPPWVQRNLRTLQRYHAGPNQDRIEFMERHSTLGKRGLGVSIEQVSIFLCGDNTVISFFEYSAQDVEMPIVRRLNSANTILRQSCDASMLTQSILDTIIDLAIPVTSAYQDAIGDLELEVLTDPDIHESTLLYILTSEVAVLRNAIAPVTQLIGALKDHKPAAAALPGGPSRLMSTSGMPAIPGMAGAPEVMPGRLSLNPLQPATSNGKPGVTISPLTITYLGDVEDHVMLIQDAYDQMRRSADNLVDLIFNTVSAFQNESIKQLTVVTCFFLPLTFMTGYFGMNFDTFPGVQDHSDRFFWAIAGPVCGIVIMLLLREQIWRWVSKWATKALISRGRRRRLMTAQLRY